MLQRAGAAVAQRTSFGALLSGQAGQGQWPEALAAAARRGFSAGSGNGSGSGLSSGSSGGAGSGGGAGTGPAAGAVAAAASAKPRAGKPAEQLTPEELERALPSMFFTTSNLLWSTLVASAVAAAGLVSMVWLGTWIVGAAGAMRVPPSESAAPAAAEAAPPAKPKSLRELIEERKAELEAELAELRQLPRTPEVKRRAYEVQRELRSYRPPGPWWWPF